MRYKILRLVSAIIIFWNIAPLSSLCAPFKEFTPPTRITVRVYRLFSSGTSTGTLCLYNDTNYGCTTFVGDANHPYPYGDNNPVTIPIETDYLLDVVPSEVSVEAFHPTAVQAQAIAARSYAYWHLNHGYVVDNSSQFQVFVPYAFEALPSADSPNFPNNLSSPCASTNLNRDQRVVCDAVSHQYYISYGTYPNDDSPAFTEYFLDIRNRTISSTLPYLVDVPDPISCHPEIRNRGHGHGMSQNGAGRWARGNLSFNINKNLGSWSVRYRHPAQILAHYYTGIHIRNAHNANARLTPEYRWNPLKVEWQTPDGTPPTFCGTASYTIRIWIQNTGTTPWSFKDVALRYRWFLPDNTVVDPGIGATIPTTLAPGKDITVTLTVNTLPSPPLTGHYILSFDMYTQDHGGYFSEREPGRPWYRYDVPVVFCPRFLPYIRKAQPVY